MKFFLNIPIQSQRFLCRLVWCGGSHFLLSMKNQESSLSPKQLKQKCNLMPWRVLSTPPHLSASFAWSCFCDCRFHFSRTLHMILPCMQVCQPWWETWISCVRQPVLKYSGCSNWLSAVPAQMKSRSTLQRTIAYWWLETNRYCWSLGKELKIIDSTTI